VRRTSHDEEVFRTAFRALAPLDDTDLDAGLALCRVRVLSRGEHILRAGEHATEVVLVIEGLLREYFVVGDDAPTERTKAFVLPSQTSGSLADLLSGEASRAFIVADEKSRVLVARYDAMRALGARPSGWAAVGRPAVESPLPGKAAREGARLGPGGGRAGAPRVAGAGVEEHADHDQIDQRLGGGLAPARGLDHRRHPVELAGAEVAEAAMDRDAQRRIGLAGHADDAVGDDLDPAAVDGEVAQLAEHAGLEHVGGADPDRERRPQVGHGGRGVGAGRGHDEAAVRIAHGYSSPRPLALASSSPSGTLPSGTK